MITLWQWSTPSRLTPATSLPSLLVRSAGRPSLSLRVRSIISGNLTGSGGEMFGHWKRVNSSFVAQMRCRALPVKLNQSGVLWEKNHWGGEMFGLWRHMKSGSTLYWCSLFYWVHQSCALWENNFFLDIWILHWNLNTLHHRNEACVKFF